MKVSSLWRWLIAVIIIIIIIGGVIIIIVRPDPPPCLVCGIRGLRFLGISEVILGVISLGLANKIRNDEKFN